MWVEKFWNLSSLNYFFAPHFSTGLQTVPPNGATHRAAPNGATHRVPPGAVGRDKPLWAQLWHGEPGRGDSFGGANGFDGGLP